jgi:hypothetical protein
VAEGRISSSHNQEELLETVRESHDSRSFEPGVNNIRAKINNLCRMDGADNRKEKFGEGPILTLQVKIFLNENGFVRLAENSKSFSVIQQHAVYISEDHMLQLIQLARNIDAILLNTSSTTEMSKDLMTPTNLLKVIISDNRPHLLFDLRCHGTPPGGTMLKHFLKLGLNANWRNWALETL